MSNLPHRVRQLMENMQDLDFHELNKTPEFCNYVKDVVAGMGLVVGKPLSLVLERGKPSTKTARTNGRVIFANPDSYLIDQFDGNESRFKIFMGMLVHEFAHVLHCDFEGAGKLLDQIEEGKIPGVFPADAKNEAELRELLKTQPRYRLFFERLYGKLNNYAADQHDEEKLIDEYEGGGNDYFPHCLRRTREALRMTATPYEDLLLLEQVSGNHLTHVLSLVFQRLRYGAVACRGQEIEETAEWEVQPYLPYMERMVQTDLTAEKFEAINGIVDLLYPLIKERIDSIVPPPPGSQTVQVNPDDLAIDDLLNCVESASDSTGSAPAPKNGRNAPGVPSGGRSNGSSGSSGSSGGQKDNSSASGSSGAKNQGENSSGSNSGSDGQGNDNPGSSDGEFDPQNRDDQMGQEDTNGNSGNNSGSNMEDDNPASDSRNQGDDGAGTEGQDEENSNNQPNNDDGGLEDDLDCRNKKGSSDSSDSSADGSNPRNSQDDPGQDATSEANGNGSSESNSDEKDTSDSDSVDEGSGSGENPSDANGKSDADSGEKEGDAPSNSGSDSEGQGKDGSKDQNEATSDSPSDESIEDALDGHGKGSSNSDQEESDSDSGDKTGPEDRGTSSDESSSLGDQGEDLDKTEDDSTSGDKDKAGQKEDGVSSDDTDSEGNGNGSEGEASEDDANSGKETDGNSDSGNQEDGDATSGTQDDPSFTSPENGGQVNPSGSTEDTSSVSDEPFFDPAEAVFKDIQRRVKKGLAEESVEEQQMREIKDVAESTPLGDIHRGVRVQVRTHGKSTPTQEDIYKSHLMAVKDASRRLQKMLRPKLEDLQRGMTCRHKQTGLSMDVRDAYRLDQRFYTDRKAPKTLPGVAVLVLVDQSGSMAGERLLYAQRAAILLQDFCRGMDFAISVMGHNASRNVMLDIYTAFDEVSPATRSKLGQFAAGGCNRDGAALQVAAALLEKRPEELKFLFIISDGQPSHGNYEGERAAADIRSIVEKCHKKGIDVLAAAIGSDKETIEKIYRDDFVDISTLAMLPKIISQRLIKKIQRRI